MKAGGSGKRYRGRCRNLGFRVGLTFCRGVVSGQRRWGAGLESAGRWVEEGECACVGRRGCFIAEVGKSRTLR